MKTQFLPEIGAKEPVAITDSLLTTIIAAMLMERERDANPELTAAFELLLHERHLHFHVKLTKRKDPIACDWKKCANPVCRQAKDLLAKNPKNEIDLNPFAMQRAMNKRVMFQRNPGRLKVFVEEKALIEVPGSPLIVG